jgi:DNA-binding IclR family transcriptional regulator
VRSRLAVTRDGGYAVNPGLVVEGSWGVAAAVFDRTGRPRSALSLTGVRSRFTDERIPALGRLPLDWAHALSKRDR